MSRSICHYWTLSKILHSFRFSAATAVCVHLCYFNNDLALRLSFCAFLELQPKIISFLAALFWINSLAIHPALELSLSSKLFDQPFAFWVPDDGRGVLWYCTRRGKRRLIIQGAGNKYIVDLFLRICGSGENDF